MTDQNPRETDAARLALDAFGVAPDADIAFVKQRENEVYRVRAPGIDRSLRLHRIGYRTDAELRSETAAIEMFGRAGIRVPLPATAPDGDVLVVVVDGAGQRRQATMQTWIDGAREFGDSAAVFDGTARPSDDELRALGALIAQMHDIAGGGSPADYVRPAWDRSGLTGPGALWGQASRIPGLDRADSEILDAAEARLADELGALPTSPDRFGVIHADFTFENVLVTAEGLVALDFDDSGEGWYLFDLATPAFWCARHPDGAALIAALVDGYQSIRPLTAHDEGAWHAMLMGRALSYLGWAADRPGGPASEFHERVVAPWVVAAARRYLSDAHTGWPSLAVRAADDRGSR